MELPLYKEKREVRMKSVRRGTAYSMESKNIKEAAYVSKEKDVWHRHANMRITEDMENEQLPTEWFLLDSQHSLLYLADEKSAMVRMSIQWLAGLITYRIDIFDGEMKIEKKKVDVADKKGLKLN
ncbi:hypothetical protein WN48_05541 [Eufriesea mexicana]|uniref:Uncharacterized protein n=1 Tax=Eufriesea mexicana TaxID=516756 RepID=A0A310SFV6_9HYME|nr:hypothetical protein WN48_05541 [Eufriesea mexicana]